MTARLIGTDAQLGVLNQLAEDDGRQRFGPELAAGDGPAIAGIAHAPLDERGHAVGLFQGHVEGGLADDGRVVVEQQHGAGREHVAVAVGQRDRLAVIVQSGDGREGGAQVDADQFACADCHALYLCCEGLRRENVLCPKIVTVQGSRRKGPLAA